MYNGGGGFGCARVPIPKSFHKTIQNIKEIAAGKHSDEDIYAMLKECNMDPNDTVQRLLYLDSFHEVKRKRDKKKVWPDVGRTSDNYRLASSMQRRGARGDRDNYTSFNVSEDSGGTRKGSYRQESGTSNYRGKSSRAPSTDVQKRDDNALPPVTSGPKKASDGTGAVGSIQCENGTLGSATESKSGQKEAKLGASREVERNILTAPEIMTPSSKMVPSIPQTIKSYHLPEPPHEISSTITDQALGFQNNHNSWPAKQVYNSPKGIVSQSETVEPQSTTETSPPRWNDDTQDQTTPELDQKLENLSVSSHRVVVFPDHLQVPEALRRGLTFGSLDAALGQTANSDNASMLMKEISSVADVVGGEPSQRNHHALPINNEVDNSLCPPSHSSTLGDDDDLSAGVQNFDQSKQDRLGPAPSHPQMTTTSTLRDDVSSAEVQRFDQSKQDRLGQAPPITLLQTTPEYGFGITPPVLAPHITRLEGADPHASNSTAPSTSGSTPPVLQASGQNSFALPPHLLPYLRQAYPSNFIPYNPYFSHLYMTHTPHQFLGHNILPQQPTTGNVYASPATAAVSKYTVPPILKTSSVGGNMTHFGVPSGYGSFGASNVGYSSTPALTSGSSNSTENLMAAEVKENNIYPASLKQNEEAHTWTTTHGRDLSSLPPNYFYNVPPGHRVPFPPHSTHGPPFPGVYHLNQAHSLPAQSSRQSFSQQPLAAGGAIEFAVPSSQLPHSQINWNNQLLNKENI